MTDKRIMEVLAGILFTTLSLAMLNLLGNLLIK